MIYEKDELICNIKKHFLSWGLRVSHANAIFADHNLSLSSNTFIHCLHNDSRRGLRVARDQKQQETQYRSSRTAGNS